MARTRKPSSEQMKEPRVQMELDRLMTLFNGEAGTDRNKLDFVQRQIEQLAWYNISIADLQKQIDQAGTLISYDNGGGQSGVRVNPDLKTLMEYQKATTAIVKTLIPIVPANYRSSTEDLAAFKMA